MPRRELTPERKTAYYVGNALAVVGLLVFGSIFVSAALNFGNFQAMESLGRSAMLRAVIGMGLLVVGMVVRAIGSHGLAGSGVVIDPEAARRDIEPWSRMAGGVVRDALDESGLMESRRRPESAADDFDQRLRKLHQLYVDGILSEEEYQREKVEILEEN